PGGYEVDDDLTALRDHVAGHVAHRMGQALNRGEPVQWTPRLRFLPTGLECRPQGLTGPGEPFTVPYGAVGYTIRGAGRVLRAGRALHREPLGSANLYPGLTLLGWIQEALFEAGERGQAPASFRLPRVPRSPDGAFTVARVGLTPAA